MRTLSTQVTAESLEEGSWPESFMFIQWSVDFFKSMGSILCSFPLLPTLTCVCLGPLSALGPVAVDGVSPSSQKPVLSPLSWIHAITFFRACLLRSPPFSVCLTGSSPPALHGLHTRPDMAHIGKTLGRLLPSPSAATPLLFTFSKSLNPLLQLPIPLPPISVRIMAPVFRWNCSGQGHQNFPCCHVGWSLLYPFFSCSPGSIWWNWAFLPWNAFLSWLPRHYTLNDCSFAISWLISPYLFTLVLLLLPSFLPLLYQHWAWRWACSLLCPPCFPPH